MKTVLAAVVGLCLFGGVAAAEETNKTPEGWWKVEEGAGDNPQAEVAIIVAQDTTTPPATATPPPATTTPPPAATPPAEAAPAPTVDDEIAQFLAPRCDRVRGQYLERVMELNGLPKLGVQPEELGVWARRMPPPGTGSYLGFPGQMNGDPALAPLYGFPPVPSSLFSSDFVLQTLARDLLRCENLNQPQQPPPPPRGAILVPQDDEEVVPVAPVKAVTPDKTVKATPKKKAKKTAVAQR